jgi:hypothetical protein
VLPRSAVGYFYFVRLHGGAAGLPRFDGKAYSNSNVEYAESLDAQAAAVETAIHPQAVGWWILAALAALVGLAVVGQGLARQSILEGEDYPKLAALGADRRQLVTLGVARNLVVGLAGALGAVIVAVALSPIAPLGEARTAELSTGLSFDSLVLSLGALGTVVAVVALGIWPSLRAARAGAPHDRTLSARPPAVVGQLAQLGAPPTVVIGVRNAVERRSDGAPVPVGSALLGTLLAVIALCGTAVFGASLSHLTVTPRLYGDPFELNFSVPIGGGGASDPGFVRTLEHDRAIAAITEGEAVETSINHVPIDGVAAKSVEGSLLFSTVAGHLPRGVGQVALGVTTMRRVGAHLGSTVNLTVTLPSGEKRTVPFRVVSQVSFPVLSGIVSLGIGALYTVAGYDAAVCPPGPQHAACQPGVQGNNGGILARVVAGPRGRADVSHYLDAYQSITDVPTTPISLINFGEAVDFPLIFGAMLAVFGAATLAHLLVVSVSRRRREIGLLKVLGFVKGQVGAAVAWQVTTLALIGIVIGVPLGVVVGQAVWKAFANDLGVVPVSVVPVWLIAALAGGVLVVANLIAVAPALVATRFKPGELLRTS